MSKKISVKIGQTEVGKINENDVQTISQLTNITKNAEYKEIIINCFVNEINIVNLNDDKKETVSEDLYLAISSEENNCKQLANYLQNRTILLENFIGRKFNIEEINNQIGITSKKTATKFFKYNWSSSPTMGQGEIYLSTIFKDGRKPIPGQEKGDIKIGNTIVECKGTNGRLSGQHGYGTARDMRGSFSKMIEWIAIEAGLLDYKVLDTGEETFWSIAKNQKRGIEKNLMNIVELREKEFTREFRSIISLKIVEAWKRGYLLDIKVNDYKDFFTDTIRNDGSIDKHAFCLATLEMMFLYYHEMEKFNYLAMVNTKSGNVLIIEPKDFMDYVRAGKILLTGTPSFTDRAGNQGGVCGISIK